MSETRESMIKRFETLCQARMDLALSIGDDVGTFTTSALARAVLLLLDVAGTQLAKEIAEQENAENLTVKQP